jgi:hypothetical protein
MKQNCQQIDFVSPLKHQQIVQLFCSLEGAIVALKPELGQKLI